MKLCVFSSGSKGNSSLIQTEEFNILVDCGISKKDLVTNLELSNLTLNDIDYLFITHEHIDHIRSFNVMLKTKCVIYISKGSLSYIYDYYNNKGQFKDLELLNNKLNNKEIITFNRINNSLFYEPININNINVDIIPLSHDCNEPTGFLFTEKSKKLCYITDTGIVHSDFFDLINNCDCYLLESNHDPEVLMASDRPYYLKLRILGDNGHLSNEDSMYILTRVIGKNTKLILHAHVSEECNLSHIIELTRKRVFKDYKIDESNFNFYILEARRSKEFEI